MDITPDLINFMVILEVISIMVLSISTVSTGVFSVVTGYKYSFVMMYDHIVTGNMILSVRHWVTVDSLVIFFCVMDFFTVCWSGGCIHQYV